MDDTDYMSGPIRTSGEAWDKIHDELLTAGIKYRDASEGVQQLRERFEFAQYRADGYYDILKQVRSALEDEAGVEFDLVVADEVRALADERDTARSAVDDLQWKLGEQRRARNIERDTFTKVAAERDRLYSEKAELRRTVDEDGEQLRAKDEKIDRLTDELHEAREEAAAEGMSRRHAENTLAEIQDEVDGPPPFFRSRIKSILDRHYGRHDGPSPDNGFSTIPPLLGSPSLANGHHVRVVGGNVGNEHKGELGRVEHVDDDHVFPVQVRFSGGDLRKYFKDELERV